MIEDYRMNVLVGYPVTVDPRKHEIDDRLSEIQTRIKKEFELDEFKIYK
jgi:RNase H-fold protein (predicted Holliday junction resolvase)